MDYQTFIDAAWTEHAAHADTVASRVASQALALVTDESRVVPLAHLAQHVFGDHLGRWTDGLAFLDQLAALPVTQGAAAQTVARFQHALRLAGGLADGRPALDTSERIRVTALASAQLGAHNTARSLALLREAVAAAEAAALPDQDLAHRNLAIAGNGIASTLEEVKDRSAAQTQLMLRAAQVGRRFWALAGTWLETERADYRLAMSHLSAGLLAQARQHAQESLALIQAQGNVPLEAFFAWDALARIEHAAGAPAARAQALAQARTAFAALEPADQAWCRPSLDALGALGAPGAFDPADTRA